MRTQSRYDREIKRRIRRTLGRLVAPLGQGTLFVYIHPQTLYTTPNLTIHPPDSPTQSMPRDCILNTVKESASLATKWISFPEKAHLANTRPQNATGKQRKATPDQIRPPQRPGKQTPMPNQGRSAGMG